MNCVKFEKQNLCSDVFTIEKEARTRQVAAGGIVMSLLFVLLIFCHSAFVQSCDTYLSKNKREVIQIECLPSLLLHEPWDAPTLNVHYNFNDNLRANWVGRFRWDESFPTSDLILTPGDKLIVIIHGYTENADEPWIYRLISAYFGRPDSGAIKAISVDWERGAMGSTFLMSRNFVQAASNSRMVGRITGAFLGRLMRAYNIGERSLHIMGHSLGAHVMGEAIRVLHEEFLIKAGRATAFDAASPIFEWKGIFPDREHTHYLEAIHTASATSLLGLLRGQVGFYRPYGHIDLYPNGGVIVQPACRASNFFFCSHRRGYIYYTDMLERSVGPCDFEGIECRNVMEAVSAQCSGRRLAVWEQMRNRSNRSRIVYFMTNFDRLILNCRDGVF